MSESKVKKTRKPKVKDTDLSKIHLVFDEEGKKIVLAEVNLNAEGTGIVPITNIKDVTDQFKNVGLMLAAYLPVKKSIILSGESNDDSYVYTIFLKTVKEVDTQTLIDTLATSGLIEINKPEELIPVKPIQEVPAESVPEELKKPTHKKKQ